MCLDKSEKRDKMKILETVPSHAKLRGKVRIMLAGFFLTQFYMDLNSADDLKFCLTVQRYYSLLLKPLEEADIVI